MNRTSGHAPSDLLVIGGGMAGLTAGAWAARNGARVVVAERAPTLGGSATFAGFVWTTPTFEALRAVNPGGDPELGRVLVDGFVDGVDWVRSVGADCGPAVTVLRYGRGHRVDTNGYIRACEQILREHGLLFNVNGERFTDETAADHLTTMALTGQPEARGLLVGDAVTYREWITGSYVEGIPAANTFEACRRRGARCAVADDVDEFELIPEDWGYPGPKIRDTIEAFNAAARDGSGVSPSREFDPRPLDQPPYYVIEAAPAITFSLGGLLIDREARVRGRLGGTVPGLLAAGSDVGGLYHGAYAGGLAAALIFGLTAARTALAPGQHRHGRSVPVAEHAARPVERGAGCLGVGAVAGLGPGASCHRYRPSRRRGTAG
jgi:succinate dehydrogenase/fumarate reductase flavoprotein subunit